MINVSRAEWDARPSECSSTLDGSRVTLFIVHYSGASRSQTPRSIQNFCMDNKNHCDVDYNDLVRGEYRYRGRGWKVGGHTLNHNSTSYGVCMIGQDPDVTDADKRTIREIYDEVCKTLGRQLTMTTHRNVLGASYTSCPGNQLDAWVDAGMPYPEVEDVANRYEINADQYHWEGTREQDPIKGIQMENGSYVNVPNLPLQRLKRMETDLDRIDAKLDDIVVPQPAPVDPTAIKAVLLDPEVLGAIAKAVNDDQYRRLAQ